MPTIYVLSKNKKNFNFFSIKSLFVLKNYCIFHRHVCIMKHSNLFQGIPELKEKIFNITLQQEYMGEHIPAVWLTFENNIAR